MSFLWSAVRFLGFAAALLLLPSGMGYLFLNKRDFDRGFVFLFGMCALFSWFELIYLPFFALGLSFTLMTAVFFVTAAAFATAGFFLKSKRPPLKRERKVPLNKKELAALIAAALVILWQLVRVTFGAGTWNIDDSWYVSLSNTALYTDDIMRTDPASGLPENYFEQLGFMAAYVFSPWPLFWAMFSKLFEFSAAVLQRTLLPGFFILLFYYFVFRLLSFLFRGDRERTLFALAIIAVFYEICAVATNLRFTWIICYPWSGKGFGASVVSPLALWFFLLLEDERDAPRRRSLWLGIFFANLAGCMTASSCAEMSLMLLGCWGLAYVLRRRDLSAIWKLGLCCSPSLALMAAHLFG